MERIAVLDLGTNTFHLQIVSVGYDTFEVLFKEKISVKIGKGGIGKNIITEEAQSRALNALHFFKTKIQEYKVAHVHAIATSAFRNAQNGLEFSGTILRETGIFINIINGLEEALLIFEGVKLAIKMDIKPYLVVDIGGGSVEFIIGNKDEIFWKQSFEIGGQRLMDKFHKTEPISPLAIEELTVFLKKELEPVERAIKEYLPIGLIGSSGTFDTLAEIYYKKNEKNFDIDFRSQLKIPVVEYNLISQEIKLKSKEERLEIPGMIEMRADMAVVACCLIDFILSILSITHINVSTYALKEGIISKHLAHKE